MFQKGDCVVYKNNGVCVIDDIRYEQFGKLERQEFYVLHLFYDNGAVVYVPISKEQEEQKMRAPITKEQAELAISQIPDISDEWTHDDKLRAGKFHGILENGNVEELLRVIKSIYKRSGELTEMGRKLRSSDEIILKKAQTNLYGELAYALDITPDEAGRIVLSNLTE